VDEAAPTQILGYYSVLAHVIDTGQIPHARKLPRRLACVLLGRLAVDLRGQRRGLGRLMLVDAIARTRATIEAAAGIGLVVDALHERATEFYRRFGFEAFNDDPLRLFLRVDWP
jgi:GNAT superfamily N-acetyltransferase